MKTKLLVALLLIMHCKSITLTENSSKQELSSNRA